MNKKKYDNVLLGSGITLIVLTLLIYALGIMTFGSLPIYWVSLALLLVSEIALIGILVSYQKDIVGISRVVAGVLYVVATAGVSLGFILLFPRAMSWFLLLNGIVIAIMVNAYLLLGRARKHINKAEQEMMLTTQAWKKAELAVYALLSDERYEGYKLVLTTLYEAIKYSDHSSLGSEANVVFNKVNQLNAVMSKQEEEQITQFIQDLIKNIKVYNYEEKRSK